MNTYATRALSHKISIEISINIFEISHEISKTRFRIVEIEYRKYGLDLARSRSSRLHSLLIDYICKDNFLLLLIYVLHTI